jgi:hypothetical protein
MASRGKRILIGCGIGCAALLVLGIGSCVTFVVWINQPGELLQPDRLVGGDTSGYVEVTLRLEDPGTRQVVDKILGLMRELRESNRAPLPRGLNDWLIGFQSRRDEQQIREMFPMVLAWGVRPGEGEADDLHLFALSLEKHGNRMRFVDWLLGLFMGFADPIEVHSHDGEKLYHVPGEMTFFLRGSTVFFTSDLETATRAVDRLGRPTSPGVGPTEVQELLLELPEGAPLRGAVGNENGELQRLWEVLVDEQDLAGPAAAAWRQVHALTVAGGFDDRAGLDARFNLVLDGGAPDDAGIEALGGAIASAFDSPKLPVEVEARSKGNRVVVDLHVDDLPGVLDAWMPKISVEN